MTVKQGRPRNALKCILEAVLPWAREGPVSSVLPTKVCNFHAYMISIVSSSVHLMPALRVKSSQRTYIVCIHHDCPSNKRNSLVSLHIMYSVASNNRQKRKSRNVFTRAYRLHAVVAKLDFVAQRSVLSHPEACLASDLAQHWWLAHQLH